MKKSLWNKLHNWFFRPDLRKIGEISVSYIEDGKVKYRWVNEQFLAKDTSRIVNMRLYSE